MILLAPLLIPFVIGFLSCALILNKTSVRNKGLLTLLLSPVLGLSLCSLILFWGYFAGTGIEKPLTLAVAVVSAVYLFLLCQSTGAFQSWRTDIRQTAEELLSFFSFRDIFKSGNTKLITVKLLTILSSGFFIFFLCEYIFYFTGKISWNIFGGWDARYFWNLKAKFLFRDPAYWRSMFDPVLSWAHPDYPLLLPGILAWGWNMNGSEFLLWAPVVDLIFFISIAGLILWYLGSYAGWPAGFFAAGYLIQIPMFHFWSTTQYADIPLSFFFTAASLFLILAYTHGNDNLFLLSGILTGLSAWTKNEGLFFTLWMLTIIAVRFVRYRSEAKITEIRHVKFFLSGVLSIYAAVLTAKIVLGVEGGEYLGSNRGATDYFQLLFGNFSKTQFIALCFAAFKLSFEQWGGLWILFFSAAAVGIWKKLPLKYWVLPLLVLLTELGYFAVLHVAPSEIKMQVSVSLNRLMMHTAVMALVFTFESMSAPYFRAASKKT